MDEDSKYLCRREGCTKVFKRSNARAKHERVNCKAGDIVVTTQVATFYCSKSWCSRQFNKDFNRTRHEKTCEKKVPNICRICNKQFKRKEHLKNHQRTHDKVELKCPKCNKSYKKKPSYDKHVLDCERTCLFVKMFPDKLKCPNCSNIFKDNDAFDLHIVMCDENNMFTNFDIEADHCPSMIFEHNNDDVNNGDNDNSDNNDEDTDSNDHNQDNNDNDNIGNSDNRNDNDVSNNNDDINNGNDDRNTVDNDNRNDNDNVSNNNDDINNGNDDRSTVDNDNNTANNNGEDNKQIDPLLYNLEIADSTLRYLKTLRHQSKRSSVKHKEFANLCHLLFKDKFSNFEFMEALSEDLRFNTVDDFYAYISLNTIEVMRRGRPIANKECRQKMYNHWLNKSEISADRRNARHLVKRKKLKLSPSIQDLEDSNISESITKRGVKFKAQKYIYTQRINLLYEDFMRLNPDIKASLGTYYNCKPFYISPATNREMEGCCCIKCLNPHSLYEAIRKSVNGLPYSLTQYLTSTFECPEDMNIGCHQRECIRGSCRNNCKINNESGKNNEREKAVSYYLFERVAESYFDKHGNEKEFYRTARRDHENSLRKVYNILQECAVEYLEHRYNVSCDNVYWNRFLEETSHYVIWLDYSMNINLTPKREVQSAHFSGKQHTLHDSLIRDPETKQHTYVYHISDDTNHDSVMTTKIIRDIIEKFPKVIESGHLILRSDNCTAQYKSRFIFKQLIDLSIEYNIQITWFYGEAGHGRGLIDAMAWFGCKGPLRHAIISEDMWFPTASEMVAYLSHHFNKDESKQFFVVDPKENAETRSKHRSGHPIKGSSYQHVISIKDGHVSMRLSIDGSQEMLDLTFHHGDIDGCDSSDDSDDDDYDSNDYETNNEIEGNEDVDFNHRLEGDELLHLIELNSYVAIRSPPGSVELFYIMRIIEKGIALSNMSDVSNKHFVLKGETYFIGEWISFRNEGRKTVQYVKAKNCENALINAAEIFSTNLALDDKLHMDIGDYRTLCCGVY